MTNFAELLATVTAAGPGRPALKLDERTWTYGALDDAIARVAGVLRRHSVGPGDRVAIQLPTGPLFPMLMFGALRLGAVIVPLNPLLKGREVAHHLTDSGAKLIVSGHELADAASEGASEAGVPCVTAELGAFEAMLGSVTPVREITPREDQDVALLIYTSGTTGKPKGAALTNAVLAAAAAGGTELCDMGPGDVALITLPLFHVFGLMSMMCTTLAAGGMVTLVPRFDGGKVLEVMARDGVTIFGGVPTMLTAMLHHPDRAQYNLSSVRICISGGAAIPVEVLSAFEEAFGCKVLEGYGLSETAGIATFSLPDRDRKAGSIGVPILGTDIRIVDGHGQDVPEGERGELIMRGPTLMAGYWNQPEATDEAIRGGWFHTGDIAVKDSDGYFFIVDRKKDMIIRGGYNVYPRELEEVIYAHPAVREAAVVGVPHVSLGEEVAAVVALKQGADLAPDALRAYMKERVAAYKYPRIVWMVDELPKGPTGKILKREIKIPGDVAKPSA
jgi:long-chain acyl-CoA synthetase